MNVKIGGVRDDDTVYCEACGTIHDNASRLVSELREQVEVLKTELTIKVVQNSRLKGEQARRVEAHPQYSQACGVLTLWQSTCAPRAKAVTESRVRLVLDRLGEFSKEELEQCVIGYAKFPYIVNRERCTVGKKSERFVKAETIFADAGRVENGMALAERGDDEQQLPDKVLQRIPWVRVRKANYDLLLRALRRRFGDLEDDGFGNLVSPCPQCGQGISPLTIYQSDYGAIARCHVCGATETQLLALLTTKRKATDGVRDNA